MVFVICFKAHSAQNLQSSSAIIVADYKEIFCFFNHDL